MIAPSETPEIDVGRRNMRLLIQLRWIAVIGQLVTIVVVERSIGIELPILSLLVAIGTLVMVNLVSLLMLRRRADVANAELLLALMFDVGALTWQLHQTGGLTNPFSSLFLLQVVLGAMLLRPWSSWAVAGVTSLCLGMLMLDYRPLAMPTRYSGTAFDLYVIGSLICFALIAVLLVLFVTRVNRNLRDRDATLAAVRQQAIEEEHIVRMGLLASGAAHELGTPLSSLSVILGDWQRSPQLANDGELAQDIADMQAEVARCKAIVTGILMSAGEARGLAPKITTVRHFLDEIVADVRSGRLSGTLDYQDRFGKDVTIVSDPALKQVIGNIIDNAAEVSPDWIGLSASREQDALLLEISDQGPGFTPEMLESFGQPYRSTKGRPGGGLGLFLLVNVLRKLGGRAQAHNREAGGAVVTVSLPLAAIAVSEERQ